MVETGGATAARGGVLRGLAASLGWSLRQLVSRWDRHASPRLGERLVDVPFTFFFFAIMDMTACV